LAKRSKNDLETLFYVFLSLKNLCQGVYGHEGGLAQDPGWTFGFWEWQHWQSA